MKITKLLLSFIVLTLFLNFTACSNDDDKTKDSIVGSWKFDTVIVDELKTSHSNYDAKIKPVLEQGVSALFKNSSFEFTADGKVTIKEGDDKQGAVSATYTFDNDKLTIVEGVNNKTVYTALLNDGKLHLYEDYTAKFDVMDVIEAIGAIGDDALSLKIEKAIVKISYKR